MKQNQIMSQKMLKSRKPQNPVTMPYVLVWFWKLLVIEGIRSFLRVSQGLFYASISVKYLFLYFSLDLSQKMEKDYWTKKETDWFIWGGGGGWRRIW